MAQQAVVAYLAALLAISVRYSAYAMYWYWWLFGIIGVVGFFMLSNYFSRKWANIHERNFKKNVFWTAFLIRVVMVFFLYWFFDHMNGRPFMFHAADAFDYGEEGRWMAHLIREGQFQTYLDYKFRAGNGISDAEL